ncbi:hypothetical protein FPZ12_020700 [Amycolatopsis acidicola]|uniref:Uncharacterized protein n=1 Tax=Amycolatopsis acidicola TaxID=2596893 RepID=A0A5N0UZQ7_9PSEU|nr:hypothetical protein [Amycolatopsis acidicola]KAA9159324.1 hypothetical protein FPZ12_020700 [Amycolatopsis acidicola]
MPQTASFTIGYAICLALGLFDIVSVGAAGTGGAPPTPVLIVGVVCGVVTWAAALPAWRRNRTGLMTLVVSRVLSALPAIPAFFATTPTFGLVISAVTLLLTVVGVGLISGAARGRALVR